ncbi:MAG: GNAT family N-acetyltransferase [Deltaproteobacteria bacterium]|nr:GNAT family N-acetyltransferase [Deltaproteobacteria bacterium]
MTLFLTPVCLKKLNLQIRKMELSEIDAVLDLHLEGLEREIRLLNQIIDGKSVDLSGRSQLKKILWQMIHIDEGRVFVAKEDNLYLGYCLATKKIYPAEIPPICGCINGIYVKETTRRNGVGTKLFKMAVAWLKQEGVTYMELYHMINDERAGAFWKKMGFVNVQYNCAMKI